MNHIYRAVNEQLRGFSYPDYEIEQERRKGCLTLSQMTGPRRRSETIIIESADKGLKRKNFSSCFDVPKQKRKRRRGSRILVL